MSSAKSRSKSVVGGRDSAARRARPKRGLVRAVQPDPVAVSEQRYRSLVATASSMIVQVDLRHRITDWNPEAERLLGYRAHEVLGQDLFRFFSARDREAAGANFPRVLAGQSLRDVERTWLCRDGTERILLFNVVRLLDSRGLIVGAVGIGQDITARKRAEALLAEREAYYRSLIDTAGSVIICHKPDFTITEWNPEAERVYGRSRAEVLGRNYLDFIRPERQQAVIDRLPGVLAGKPLRNVETAVCSIDGTERTILWNADRVLDVRGKPEAVLSVGRDITDRKRARETLQQSESKYRALVEQLPAITYVAALDATSTTLYVSPQVERIVGYSPADYQTDPDIWRKRLHPQDRARVLEELRRVHAAGGRFAAEYRMMARDGRVVWVRDEAAIVHDQASRPLFLQGVMLDITERKQAEKQLADYQEQLRSLASELSLAEERQRRRIATELHDHIGQNLALAKIKLNMLSESKGDGTGRPAPPTATTRQLGAIRGLIEQAIQQTRDLVFELSPPVLYELGFEAAAEWLVESVRDEHGLSVRFHNDRRPKPLDDDIRVLLFQALRELLVNVVKHSRADRVEVRLRRADRRIRISVSDDGVGFSKKTNRSQAAGGFGLFSLRERLRHLGGQLDVESRRRQGTRVTITAPLSRSAGKAGAVSG